MLLRVFFHIKDYVKLTAKIITVIQWLFLRKIKYENGLK